jgi:hypothetical protein
MTVDNLRTARPSLRVAWIVSELLAPIVVILLVTVIVSVHAATSLLAGLGYAAVAVLFAAGLPYAVLLIGVRRGRFEDRQVRERAQRPALLAFTLASVAGGLVVLRLLDAPRDLFALMAGMVAGMAITLLVSTVWKISIHASCVAGVITSLALLVDARAWWLTPSSSSPRGPGCCSAITLWHRSP